MLFDFAGLVGVNPAALALLTAVVRDADIRGVLHASTRFELPKSTAVWNYLLRMDFVKILAGPSYEEGAWEPFERRRRRGFVECREFTEMSETWQLARELANALSESMETEDIARASVNIALSELSENVLHHADAEAGGFAVAQGWRRKSAFEIAIVDLGIGIRESLKKNPAYADIDDDANAIETALQPHVTSTPERNSGIGLYVTRLLLRDNGGWLLVRSGSGAVYAGSKDGKETRDVALPGTLVTLHANTDRPLDINRVYAMLGDDEDDNSGPDNAATG